MVLGAFIRIGREVLCLPYAGFFTKQYKTYEYILAIQQIIYIRQLNKCTLWSLSDFGIGFT